MQICEKVLNAIWALIICGVLYAALSIQYLDGEVPCPLCFLQRLGMLSIACCATLNLRFGMKMTHYGLALLSSVFGASVSLRQITLHVCPQFSTYGIPVLGYSLYTWAFLVFCCSIIGTALLMFFYDPQKSSEEPEKLSWLSILAILAVLAASAANIAASYQVCGLGPCDG